MANGTQNLIGTGLAQITPEGTSPHAIVQQLFRQKQYKDEKDRYNEHQRYQQEKDLYGIVGDALNLRDFNPVIHDEVRKAKTALAKELATRKPSLGEAHMMAQNIAQGLGGVSDQFNQADQILAATRKEHDGDKRVNAANIEAIARRNLMDEYKKTGKIDLTENPFDKAAMQYPKLALTGSNHLDIDFKNVRKINPEGGYKRTNKNRGVEEVDWKVETFPDYYDFQPGDDNNPPTITTKSEPSGIKDGNGKELPMLSEDAMELVMAKKSNKLALLSQMQDKYPDLDLKSSEAEKLMRIEAYKDLEDKKPIVSSKPKTVANPVMSYSFYNGPQSAQPPKPIDLREYRDVDGDGYKGKDITELMQGFKVTGLPDGKTLLAEKVVFNPDTQKVTYKEYTSRDSEGKMAGGTRKTVSLTKFLQDIKSNNPNTDMKFLEGLYNAIIGESTKPKGSAGAEVGQGGKKTERPPLSSFGKQK